MRITIIYCFIYSKTEIMNKTIFASYFEEGFLCVYIKFNNYCVSEWKWKEQMHKKYETIIYCTFYVCCHVFFTLAPVYSKLFIQNKVWCVFIEFESKEIYIHTADRTYFFKKNHLSLNIIYFLYTSIVS